MNLQWDTTTEQCRQLFVGYCGMDPKLFRKLTEWFQHARNKLRIRTITTNLAIQVYNDYLTINGASTNDKLYLCAAGSIASCICDVVQPTEEQWLSIIKQDTKPKALLPTRKADLNQDIMEVEPDISVPQFRAAVRTITIALSGRVIIPCHIWFINQLHYKGLISPEDRAVAILAVNLYSQVHWVYRYPAYELAVATAFYVKIAHGVNPLQLKTIVVGKEYEYEATDMLPLINKLHKALKETYNHLIVVSTTQRNTNAYLKEYAALKLLMGAFPFLDLFDPEPTTVPRKISAGKAIHIDKEGPPVQRLGAGTYGHVFIATVDNVEVAVKDQVTRCTSLIEIAIMAQLSNINVQDLRGFTYKADHTLFLMDVQKTSLEKLIYRNHTYGGGLKLITSIWLQNDPTPFQLITLPIRRNYARQLLSGLKYIHASGVIHADIKPANVLISNEGIAKITDFGLAIPLVGGSDDYSMRSATVVTLPYRDINVLRANLVGNTAHYSYEIDVWAMAVLFMEMETGSIPFGVPKVEKPEATTITIIETILNSSDRLRVIEDTIFRRILLQMLDYDPVTRINAAQALAMLIEI